MMTVDYSTYPRASITGVMHPGTRVLMAVPRELIRIYFDERREPNFLPADDPRWNNLRPWKEVQAELYPDAETPQQRARRLDVEHRARVAEWEAAVRATEWGRDPLWQYGSRAYDGAGETLDPRTGRTWFPRARLMLRYGTTDLATYAERRGLPYPRREP